MTAAKPTDRTSARSSTANPTPTLAQAPAPSQRKAWKKKTPVEIFAGQIERLREDVEQKEQELNQAKRQLQKLEEARKVLESA